MKALFVTGTDTEVGKTYISAGLLRGLNQKGYTTAAMKPIASGAKWLAGRYVNDDALNLQQSMSLSLPYEAINPYCFKEPIAPHIASAKEGRPLSQIGVFDQINQFLSATDADYVVIEGAGGWLLPLNDHDCLSQVITQLNPGVILVVGLKLGCINHARLTVKAIESSGLMVAGWVINRIDPDMLYPQENIHTLTQWIKAPCLGVVGFGEDPAQKLDVDLL